MAVAAPTRDLTERSALELARAIRERELSAREVVEAHIAICRREHPRINAIVVDRYEAALAEADAADARVATAADPDDLPPLLGVPCTIKEAIAFAGMPNCAGLVSRGTYRSTQSAPTVQRLIDAGAIPLGLTNTPELCLWIETENRQYGPRATPTTRAVPRAAHPAARARPSARAAHRSASAPTSAARSGSRRCSTASSGSSPLPASSPARDSSRRPTPRSQRRCSRSARWRGARRT